MPHTLEYVQTVFWTEWCVFLAVGPTALPLLLCPESVSASPVQKFLFPLPNSSWQRTSMPRSNGFSQCNTGCETLTGWSIFGWKWKDLQPPVYFCVMRQRIDCDFYDCTKAVFCLQPYIYNAYGLNKSWGFVPFLVIISLLCVLEALFFGWFNVSSWCFDTVTVTEKSKMTRIYRPFSRLG